MEEPKTVAEKIILDVAERVVSEGDPELLNSWLNVLEGAEEQAEPPEVAAHRALLNQFSAQVLQAPEASLARLREMLASIPEVAMLTTLSLGLDVQAVNLMQPLFAAHLEAQHEVVQEARKLWEMPGPARMQLERAWLLRFLEKRLVEGD